MFHRIYQGNVYNVIHKIPDNSIDALISSPPYYQLRGYSIPPVVIGGNPDCKHEWIESNSKADLRYRGKHSYIGKDADPDTLGNEVVEGAVCKHCDAFFGQLGHEDTPQRFVSNLVYLFDLIRPKLKDTATMYINISDTYSSSGGNGSPKRSTIHTQFGKTQDIGAYQKPHKAIGYPPKTKLCIPERFCTAMVDNGWILRSDLIWFKVNSTPESVNSRWSRKYEHIYFFTKSPDYYFNINAIKRTITTETIERYQRALKLGAYSINGKYSNGELGKPTQPPVWVSELNVPTVHKQRTLFSEDFCLEKDSSSDSKFKEVDDPELFGSPRARSLSYDSKNIDTAREDYDDMNVGMGNPWDILIIPTKGIRDKHYASFNPALVEYLLTAGCPELVCSKCGAPKRQVYSTGGKSAFNIRVRDVKEGRIKHTDRIASGAEIDAYNEEEYVSDEKEHIVAEGCNCDENYTEAIVLDPFGGVLTTMGVAKEMGRSSIGIELSKEYIDMGIKRFGFSNTFYKFEVVKE